MDLLVSSWRPFLSYLVATCCFVACALAICKLQAAERAISAEKQAAAAVREALQREAYGLDADRQQLLSSALQAAPDHAGARWHQGYVRNADGKWQQAGEGVDLVREAILQQYRERRQKTGNQPGDHRALAIWCAKHGLKEQERAHWQAVVEAVPDDSTARTKLGFVRIDSEWVSRADQLREQARATAEKAAAAKWAPTINYLLAMQAAGQVQGQQRVLAQFEQIRDPAALPLLESQLASRSETWDLLVVQIAAQMTDPAAALTLARRSILSPSARVRKVAAEKLKECDRECFVPQLINAMYTPVQVRPAGASLSRSHASYEHFLVREGFDREEFVKIVTHYRTSPNTELNRAEVDENERQVGQRAAKQNAETELLNGRIAATLCSATGTNLPDVPKQWWDWWSTESEVFIPERKTTEGREEMTSIRVTDRGLEVYDKHYRKSYEKPVPLRRYDCLAAGTPIWTEQGLVAIEKMQIGDLVLSRDVESGELAFKPVLRTTIRPAGFLFKIRAGSETFETSDGHLFWVSGRGWVKSRDLESGMVLHTANGPIRVMEVSAGSHAPTYNLIVADFNTYFVGQQKLLSHDKTMRRPTNMVVPGLKAE